MLKAKKSRWFEKIFTLYNRNLLKRRFDSFNVRGLKNLVNSNSNIPQIIYSNHSGWWDGLLIYEICKKLNLDFYVMMEEKQLKSLSFFRKIGAFSVVREKPREAVRSINYAASILREIPKKTLLIFPQGEIQPNERRPLKFFNGLSRIIEKAGECEIIPIAIRYEFRGEFKPEIYVDIGNPKIIANLKDFDARAATIGFENQTTDLLDNLYNDITTENFADFDNLFESR